MFYGDAVVLWCCGAVVLWLVVLWCSLTLLDAITFVLDVELEF
jgi:hypothetical protein